MKTSTKLIHALTAGLLFCTATTAFAQTPSPSTNGATSITYNQAQLNGYVVAGNRAVTVSFQWGPTAAYGGIANGTPATVPSGSASGFSATINTLAASTTYHYRAVAAASDTTIYGQDVTFTTQQLAAPSIYHSGKLHGNGDLFATFFADINSNNSATAIKFEYGFSATYGQLGAPSPNVVAAGATASSSCSISNLAANTLYHYRWSVSNILGITNTADAVFNTTPLSVAGISGSGFHLYPNPVSGLLVIDMPQGVSDAKLHITDIMGKAVSVPAVKIGQQYQLDMNGLAYGSYTVLIVSNNQRYSQVIIKK